MCVLSTLCGNVDKHSPLCIYIYLYLYHYNDVILSAMASQITGVSSVCSTRKHQNSASLAFVRGIHWWPVNSPHKSLVTRKTFSLSDVIMICIGKCIFICFCMHLHLYLYLCLYLYLYLNLGVPSVPIWWHFFASEILLWYAWQCTQFLFRLMTD